MLRFAGAKRVPKNLSVHMGVMIDKARRNYQASGINRPRRAAFEPADAEYLYRL